ncbi:MAG TPA: TetR/AcrR family transcriptional regulator [Steroidobacteraceae bacterium]|nr:TetR/AcrR family transcriptional regulator [Steroidobacteraceae bacterium]
MDTRQRIVLAAMHLFWEKGYGSTSVSDILKSADINSGSLYHYFPGKQDVLLAVLEDYQNGLGNMLLNPAWEGVTDPIERIFRLLDRYRRSIIETDCTYGCPIGSLALEIHEPDPVIREQLVNNFAGWVEAVEGCLREAGERLPATINRRELAQFVLTTMEGGVMLARTYRDVAQFDTGVRQLRMFFDRLLLEAATTSNNNQPAGQRHGEIS